MERELKTFILKALLAAKDLPLPDTTVRQAARSAFPGVAITTGDLGQLIGELEAANLIAGTRDDLSGIVWLLTPKGKIRAQSL